MFSEERGPLVLSACLHLVILVAFAVYSLVEPDKKPEEFVFELYGDPGQQPAAPSQAFEAIKYEPEQVEMPDPKRFEPEIPDVPVPKPDPVIEEDTFVELKPIKEEPKKVEPKLSYEDYQRLHGKVDKPISVPPSREEQKVDVSKNLDQIAHSLRSIDAPTAKVGNGGTSLSIKSYFSTLVRAITDEVERHPLGARPLACRVSFDLAANGTLTNPQVVESSGDTAYDRKCIAALKQLRIFDATPDGRAYPGRTLSLVQGD